jgi:putative FmdB family regulatory protein
MPIYEYQCRCGKKHDVFHKGNRVPKHHRCSCGWMAKKVLSTGGIQCDSVNDVKWLPSACKVLQKHGEPPLQSRSEYNRYLKENHLACKG